MPHRLPFVLALLTGAFAAAWMPAAAAEEPANTKCPVTGEAVDADSPTVTHAGKTLALCCKSCVRKWNGYAEERRAELAAAALAAPKASAEPKESTAAATPAQDLSSLYVLSTCPITGKALGSMGDPVVANAGGREIRVCCKPCVAKYEADAEARGAAVDAALVASQRALYPLETCVVGGGKLGSMGDPVEHLHGNRLVRFCCAGCVPKFEKDPASHLTKIDAALREKQGATYALTTCAVDEKPLPASGAVDVVLANRLVRLCSAACVDGLKDAPATVLARVDAAREAKGKEAQEPADESAEEPAKRER